MSVTVPMEELPPTTLVGFKDSDARTAGLTVSVPLWLPRYVPVMLAGVTEVTAVVLAVKVAEVAPAATTTFAGTEAAALPLKRVTVAPPDGAGPVKVTVPVEEIPPTTLFGLKETDASTAGLMVRVVDCEPL